MLYPVTVSDAQGNVKQVHTPKQLTRWFWDAVRISWKTGKQIHQKTTSFCEMCRQEYPFKTRRGSYCVPCRQERDRRRRREAYYRKKERKVAAK